MPQTQTKPAPHSEKQYRCTRCGHVKKIKTNHFGSCWSYGHFNCCPVCPPWAKYPEFGGSTTWECLDKEREPTPANLPASFEVSPGRVNRGGCY